MHTGRWKQVGVCAQGQLFALRAGNVAIDEGHPVKLWHPAAVALHVSKHRTLIHSFPHDLLRSRHQSAPLRSVQVEKLGARTAAGLCGLLSVIAGSRLPDGRIFGAARCVLILVQQ